MPCDALYRRVSARFNIKIAVKGHLQYTQKAGKLGSIVPNLSKQNWLRVLTFDKEIPGVRLITVRSAGT